MTDRGTNQSAVKEFLYSPLFLNLRRQSSSFNPYRMLGVEYRELSHSNLLAYLLDPSSAHGLGGHYLNAFLRSAMLASTPRCVPIPVGVTDAVVVRREYMNIDLVIEFSKSRHVVGIENKIRHHERDDQLKDYQDRLIKRYPDWSKCLIFLTPHGQQSESHHNDLLEQCPIVCLGYKAVTSMLEQAPAECDASLRCFMELTVQHIKEDIVDESEARELVRQIWSDPANKAALRLIEHYKPRLADLEDKYNHAVIKRIWERLHSEALTYRYPPNRGEIRELKFKIKHWCEHGLPFEFVFHSYSDDPVLKLMLHDSGKKEHENTLNAFAQFAPELIGRHPYAPVDGWSGFNVVLSGEEEMRIDAPVVGDAGYGNETIAIALAQVDAYLDMIQQRIDEFIQAGHGRVTK